MTDEENAELVLNSALGKYAPTIGNITPKYIGKKITKVELIDDFKNRCNSYIDKFCITFSDGSKIVIFDNAKICCEERYMTTDDDIQSLVGGTLVSIEEKQGENIDIYEGDEEPDEGDRDAHEICFIEIRTDKDFVTLVNHNEHNGYYARFSMGIREVKDDGN